MIFRFFAGQVQDDYSQPIKSQNAVQNSGPKRRPFRSISNHRADFRSTPTLWIRRSGVSLADYDRLRPLSTWPTSPKPSVEAVMRLNLSTAACQSLSRHSAVERHRTLKVAKA